jgi:hypothetical protein
MVSGNGLLFAIFFYNPEIIDATKSAAHRNKISVALSTTNNRGDTSKAEIT